MQCFLGLISYGYLSILISIMKKSLLVILYLSFGICLSQIRVEQIDLSDCALELTKQEVSYDPSYFSIVSI